MKCHKQFRRKRGVELFLGVVISALSFTLGCPGDGDIGSRGNTGPGGEATKSASSDHTGGDASPSKSADGVDATAPSSEEGDAAPSKSGPSYRYEEELPLEGNVRFELHGSCRGCSGGSLVAKAKVEGSDIFLTGEVTGCKGPCPTPRPASAKVTVKRLRPRTYAVHSTLEVLDVEPLSLGPAKRADWAVFLLKQDCTKGLQGINGNERATAEFVEAANKCLSTVSPDARFETISSMMRWKNNKAFVPALISALNETKTAYLAARVLGRTEDRRAVEPLIETLSSDDESLRWDAARSLEIITRQDFGQDQERWRAWFAKNR